MTKKIRDFGIREMNEFYKVADKQTVIELSQLRNKLMVKDGITWNLEQVKFVNAYYAKINYTGQ